MRYNLRKIISGILILFLIIVITFLEIHNVYALSTVVDSVNYETDTVSAIDFNGNVWEFYGAEDWAIGDVCSMVMFTEFTCRSPKICNLRIDGVDTQSLILMLGDEVCISAGPACFSHETKPSHVMSLVAEAFLLATSIISFIEPKSLPEIYNKSIQLNCI